jgi:hypothetical protein
MMYFMSFALLGIGIEADAAGIGIPAINISVRCRSIPVPDWRTFIPSPDSSVFRHLKKLHKGTSTVGTVSQDVAHIAE